MSHGSSPAGYHSGSERHELPPHPDPGVPLRHPQIHERDDFGSAECICATSGDPATARKPYTGRFGMGGGNSSTIRPACKFHHINRSSENLSLEQGVLGLFGVIC